MSGWYKTSPPSRYDYETWLAMGYLGSYEQYCESKEKTGVGYVHYSGSIVFDTCRVCDCLADDFLCDYPVGKGVTCDVNLCHAHANEVATDTHYCPSHYKQYLAYKKTGAIKEKLDDVLFPVRSYSKVARNDPINVNETQK